jgi:thiamine biosynthesis lipoprotein
MHRSTTFEAIGTRWDIQVNDMLTNTTWLEVMGVIDARITAFDHNYSRFLPDSLVTQMAQTAGTYELPADGFALLSYYDQLYQLTNGAVTPLIGQTMADAGYDAAYTLITKKTLSRPPKWESVLSYDRHHITLSRPALLDFGAAGKGYLVDIVGGIFDEAGLQNYVINAGGDILQRSQTMETLEVGLENPFDTSEAIGVAKLVNQSLCASAGSKRAWGDYHHIIDPVALVSPDQIVATWVLADDTMTADGLATALFFTEAKRLAEQFSFSYALLDKAGQLSYSSEFPLTLFEAV